MAPAERLISAPDPFAGALRLLEGSSYTGFVVAVEAMMDHASTPLRLPAVLASRRP